MRTWAFLFLVCLVVAGPAEAESPGVMSIYFDREATIFEGYVSPGFRSTYICLTSSPFTAVQGFEFGVTPEGSAILIDATCPGAEVTGEGGDFHFDLQLPLTVEPVTVLAELRVFLMDALPTFLTLHGPATNPWTALNLPNVVQPDGTVQPVCTAFWNSYSQEPAECLFFNPDIPVLRAKSYECYGIVGAEEMTWDAVKSMYR